MSNPQTEYDSPWKDIIEDYFEDFIRFFLPEAHLEIDWTRPVEFLDKELQQVVQDAALGRRLADKLVKVWLKNGAEAWVLIHIEVQSQHDSDLAERMFVYHYRIYDRYRKTVVSIAVLGDESKSWRPNQFIYQKWGTKIEFNFSVVKLLDYQQGWSGLESSRNPFAVVVMAHLKTLETQDSRLERKKWKLALIRRLYEENYSRTDVINLLHFIDWMMSLPEELELEFWQSIQKLEEERRMRYVTSIERIGRQDGEIKGIKVGLLKGIELCLKEKFGDEGLAVLPEISKIDDSQILETILSGLVRLSPGSSLDELRQLYQPKSGEQSSN